MNLFQEYKSKILLLLNKIKKNQIIDFSDNNIKNLTVELPPKEIKSDISCNAALILSKINSTNPQKLALVLKEHFLNQFNEFDTIEISKQGFINICFKNNFWQKYLIELVQSKSIFGSNLDINKKYIVEFVSANPTGPLHVGHCRGAILGDVISNLLKFNGHNVTKEYYVNDYGSQIKNFVNSVYYRILEIKEEKKFPDDKNLYPGDYIIGIAKKIIEKNIFNSLSNLDNIYEKLSSESLRLSMNLIQQNLNLLGVNHDSFIYETDLIKKNLVKNTVEELKKNNFVYMGKLSAPKGELTDEWESRDQLLFNSTNFGDDTDRALQKSDGSWTYFASDIAYHAHKVNRNFDFLINILGADHSGYIKRIVAATKAVSKNKKNLICKVSQLVKLFKQGKPFKMSKRKGDYITVEDLINEVGRDSVRFMMLSRSNDVELEFDFEKVTEKSKENPVFYIQYAFARINSIFSSLKFEVDDPIDINKNDFKLNSYEIDILKKISEWPKCVELSLNRLEPHRINFYLYELVTLFHAYWNLGNSRKEFRFISDDNKFVVSRLVLLQALAIVIKNGMQILGISTPKSM